nr:NADP-dependent oxidoreductase [Actinoplanes philippinensis]
MADIQPDLTIGYTPTGHELIRGVVESAPLVEELNLDVFAFGEHHNRPVRGLVAAGRARPRRGSDDEGHPVDLGHPHHHERPRATGRGLRLPAAPRRCRPAVPVVVAAGDRAYDRRISRGAMSRKIQFTRYGGPEVLELVDVPRPQPAAGQVLVEVVVASLNPAEVGIREGAFHERWPAEFPQGMGHDFAGVVVGFGPDVTGFAVGDEVVGFAQRGAMADFALVDAGSVGPKPAGLGFAAAAVVPAAGATAWATVAAVDPAPGETVFVSAASGGVGVLAGQLARLAGARVVGATSAGHMHRLLTLGIEPVEYGRGLQSRLQAMIPDGLDAVIDTFGGGYVDLAIEFGVSPERINTIADHAAVQRYGVQARGNGDGMSPAVWSEVQALIADGRLVVPIEAEYRLEDIARAYIDVANRRGFGKRVVRLRPDPTSGAGVRPHSRQSRAEQAR